MEYHIVITGTIGSWWASPSADYVRYVLQQNKGKEVHVGLSSYGGYVKDGLELNQAFKDHGNVHAHAFGMNASISTIAMLGCKTIDIVKGSFFLIHNTSTAIFEYDQKNKEELDKYIKEITKQRNDLATFDDVLAQMYADKTGKTKEECAAQMNKGSWMSAEEAVAFGLVDRLVDDEKSEKATVEVTDEFMNNYQNNYKETGIPPLPSQKGQSSLAAVVDKDGNPTPGFLQKALQGLKDLFHNNAGKSETMSKTKTALEKLLAVDSLPVDEKGQVVLTGEQVKIINDELSHESEPEDCQPATDTAVKESEPQPVDDVQEIKDQLDKARKDLAAKDEQIKNLQGSAGDDTHETPKDGEEAFNAKDLYNCVKNI